MAAKRRTTRKAATTATRRRSYTRAAAPRRRRSKSGVAMIPAAGATVGLTIANKDQISYVINNMSVDGVKTAAKSAITADQIKKDITYGAVGYGVGIVVKKFAPSFVKTPLGKLAKKIPKVI